MPFRWDVREHVQQGKFFLRWLLIGVPVGAVVGSGVALFLWSLDGATTLRWMTITANGLPWLLYLLPLAGILISGMYLLFGKSVEAGNNLIVDQIHEPGGGVPARMAPLVLIGTVVTHLFGGSAGREGTAVQMGGSIASTIGKWLRLSERDVRLILMAGVASGFGAVFGTPLAGAVFAMEVLAIGRMSYEALVPCLISAIIGDQVCTAWGAHHTHYSIASFSERALVHGPPHFDGLLAGKVVIASAAFGLASVIFAELAHGLSRLFKMIKWPLLRPVIGAGIVIGLALLVGRDYLGLGVSSPYPQDVTILSCFTPGGATYWSWWWKILFTAMTLSCGFKGGEVTPLFFIGAALGNTLAHLLGAPVDLFAGLGFVAVFAGATNTPLACTLMGVELFGSGAVVYIAIACFLAYLFSGHTGIYLSQRIAIPKIDSPLVPPNASLRTRRELLPAVHRAFFWLFSSNGTEFETVTDEGGDDMAHRHKVVSREIGQLRIYMTPRTKRKAKGFRDKLFMKPLYQEIIDAAKHDGILNATAHHTTYGYTGNGKIEREASEIPNSNLNLCVELIAPRDQLELFARKHGELLQGKVMVYKHMEHWDLHHHDLDVKEASVAELDMDVADEKPMDA
jgi:H+/Cl- antiporter ClcA/PII-like signaling protein